jgi:hypothetical protein
MDLLQFYNYLSLLTFAGSLLAILGLRIVTGSTSQQVELTQDIRTSLEQTSRNCMRARSAALAREFEAHDNGALGRDANGAMSLVGFQLGSNAWRWFHVPRMTRVSIMSETFAARTDYAPEEHGTAVVLAQV